MICTTREDSTTADEETRPRFGGVRSAARNSAYLLGTQLASILIRIIYVLILVRWLSPAEYGILNYGLAWYLALISLTYLGADVVLSREVARDRDAASGLLGITLEVRGYTILLVAAVSVLAAFLLEDDARARSLVLILLVALVGRSFWMWGASVFTAYEETERVLRLEVIYRLAEVSALIAFLLVFGADLTGIAVIHSVSWCLQGIATFAAVRRRHVVTFRRSGWNAVKVLRAGVPGALFAIAMASFFQLPVMLYRQAEGTGDSLGYFALAFQLIAYLQIVPYTIASASLPILSRSAVRKDGKDRTAVLLLTAIIPIAGTALALSMSWIAGPMVQLLFGERYSMAAHLFANGVWLLIPMSLAMLFQQMLFSNSMRSPVGAVAPLLGVAVMIALFPGMTSAGGPSGSLISIFIGLSIWLACTAAELARSRFFAKRLIATGSETRSGD